MGNVRMLRLAAMQELSNAIGENVDEYRSGNFNRLAEDVSCYFEIDVAANYELLAQAACSKAEPREVENCALIYEAFRSLPRSVARDPRMWVYYTHTTLLEYSRSRWPIPADDDAALKHIKTHFFADGARNLERDNAASRLWWMASLCSDLKDMEMGDALTMLLFKSDVRANIIERPTVSQVMKVRTLVLQKLKKSYDGDKALFEREKFRGLMKQVNVKGGVMMLDVVDNLDQLIG